MHRRVTLKLVRNFRRSVSYMRGLSFQLSYLAKRQNVKRLWLIFVLFLTLIALIVLFGSVRSSYERSEPRRNIVFLKTHKCASSTVQNVLLRYGESHNLTFVLPTKLNYFGHPQRFNRIYVPYPTNVVDFNILTHHTRLNYEEMSLLMPEDTVFITMVRQPEDLVQSLYQYYLFEDFYQMDLETLIKNETMVLRLTKTNRYCRRIGFNQMAFDLGLEPDDFDDPRVVNRYCRILDKQFDLVMLSERMDESMILLMDLMRWTLDDVVAFRLNALKPGFKPTLSREGLRRLKTISLADNIIYDYFSRKFDERIRHFGEARMATALALLRESQNQRFRECVRETENSQSRVNSTKNGFAKTYLVQYKLRKNSTLQCQRMFMKELAYTELIREKQRPLLEPDYFQDTNTKIEPKTKKITV